MINDIESVLLSEREIKEIIERLGAQISRDYANEPLPLQSGGVSSGSEPRFTTKNLLMISVLKGSVVFMADLMRAITVPCAIDFLSVSSYGAGVKTSGAVKIIKDLNVNPAGFDVLVVEDILDSGVTLHYIMELLAPRGPESIRLCTFLDKPERRAADVKADYVGAVIPDRFVVGYGLDYNEKYRNLPYVGVLKPEVYINAECRIKNAEVGS